MISQLADLMGHRTQTAAKCYRLVNREKTCVAAATTLSDLTGINTNDNNLQSVKRKLKRCSLLATYSDRQVYDKIRTKIQKRSAEHCVSAETYCITQ